MTRVYKAVIEVQGQSGRIYTLRIGTAFPRDDGSILVTFDVLPPVSGVLLLVPIDQETPL